MKLYLHIGTEKTGSTALQNHIISTPPEYISTQIKTFESLGRGNNQALAFMFTNNLKIDSYFKMNGILKLEDWKAWRKQKAKALELELSRTSSKTFLISSEHLQSCLRSIQEVQELKNYLYKHFDDVKVIVYLRDPLETAISRWSTQIKCGSPILKLPPPSDQRLRTICSHKETILLWSLIFGIENIIPKCYDKLKFKNNSIHQDFLDTLNIRYSPKDLLASDYKSNETLSYNQIAVLARLSKLNNFKKNKEVYTAYKSICSHLLLNPLENVPTLSYQPSARELEIYTDYYNSSNEWLKTNFFANERSLWPSKKNYGEKGRAMYLKHVDKIHTEAEIAAKTINDAVKDYFLRIQISSLSDSKLPHIFCGKSFIKFIKSTDAGIYLKT